MNPKPPDEPESPSVASGLSSETGAGRTDPADTRTSHQDVEPDAAKRGDAARTPDTLEALIQTSVSDAMARWDAAFGVTAEDEAEVDAELEGFDARRHLAAASTRAVNRYLAERGLNEGDKPLSVTPAFIAEHGVPLMSALLGALEQAIGSAVRDQVEGRRPTQLETDERVQLDLSDLFDPEER